MLSIIIVSFHLFLTPALAGPEYTPEEIASAFLFLGLTNTSTEDEIRTQYRKLSKLYHPDKEGGSEEAMKKLNDAKDIALASLTQKGTQSSGSTQDPRDPDGPWGKPLAAEALYQRLRDRGYSLHDAFFMREIATSPCKVRVIDAISKFEIFLFHSELMNAIRELNLREDWIRLLEAADYSVSPSLQENRVRASGLESLHNEKIAELLRDVQKLQKKFGSVGQFKKIVMMGRDPITGQIAFKKYFDNAGRPPLMVFDAPELKTVIENASSHVPESVYSVYDYGVEELRVTTPSELAALFIKRAKTLEDLYLGSHLVVTHYGREGFRSELEARTKTTSFEQLHNLLIFGLFSEDFDAVHWWGAYLDRLSTDRLVHIDALVLAALDQGGPRNFGDALDRAISKAVESPAEALPESKLKSVLHKLSSETLLAILEKKKEWPNIKNVVVDVFSDRDEFYSAAFPRRLGSDLKKKILDLRNARLSSRVPLGSSLLDRCKWIVLGRF